MGRVVELTELILRDAHQSLLATRMAMEDMVPACEDLDNAGYWSLECWGGATFDSCIRFLFQVDGCFVVTVDGLARDGELAPVLDLPCPSAEVDLERKCLP